MRYIKTKFYQWTKNKHLYLKNILEIPTDKILVWEIHWISNFQYYQLSWDASRLELLLANSFYVDFFSLIHRNWGELTDNEIIQSEYFNEALKYVNKLWSYFWAKNKEWLIEKFKEIIKKVKHKKSDNNYTFPILEQIEDTDYYQVVDGHHRIALDIVSKENSISAYVIWSSFSWMQDLVSWVQMTKQMLFWWIKALRKKELYQPVTFLTTKKYPLVRWCKDRMEMMLNFLEAEWFDFTNKSHVDIACSYAYFVNEFTKLWVDSTWIEIDDNAIKVSQLSYWDLNIKNISMQNLFWSWSKKYDIVTLFSIIHHFGMNVDFWWWWLTVESLLQQVSDTTGKYLFLDSWQNHEKRFSNRLPNWDDDYIINIVMNNSNFKGYKKLWIDNDDKGKFKWNYGRSLFVFYK